MSKDGFPPAASPRLATGNDPVPASRSVEEHVAEGGLGPEPHPLGGPPPPHGKDAIAFHFPSWDSLLQGTAAAGDNLTSLLARKLAFAASEDQVRAVVQQVMNDALNPSNLGTIVAEVTEQSIAAWHKGHGPTRINPVGLA